MQEISKQVNKLPKINKYITPCKQMSTKLKDSKARSSNPNMLETRKLMKDDQSQKTAQRI